MPPPIEPDLNSLREAMKEAETAYKDAEQAARMAKPEMRKAAEATGAELKDAWKQASAVFHAALPETGSKRFWSRFIDANLVGYAAAIIIILLIIAFTYRTEELGKFLTSLSDVTQARGFITALVVLTTVLIAVLLLFSCIGSNSESSRQSFAQGKEILTIFVGIAGTCLGFYFSSGNPDKTPGSDPPAKIVTPAPASAINALAATRSNEGKTITVSGTIAEAGPGWDVVVSYKDGVFPPAGVKTGEAGEFTAVSTAPAAAPGATKATITATGPDNKTAGGSLEIP